MAALFQGGLFCSTRVVFLDRFRGRGTPRPIKSQEFTIELDADSCGNQICDPTGTTLEEECCMVVRAAFLRSQESKLVESQSLHAEGQSD